MSSPEPLSARRKGRAVLPRVLLLSCSLAAAGLSGYFLTSSPAPKRVVFTDSDGSRFVTDVSGLGEARLVNLRGDTQTHLSLRSTYSLLIFLSASDCSSCVDELRVWQSLSRKYSKSQLEVSAIIVRSSAAEAATFVKAYDPAIELYLDEYQDAENIVRPPERTPFKILVNSSGEVLLADGPRPTASGQQKFGEMVAAAMASARDSY